MVRSWIGIAGAARCLRSILTLSVLSAADAASQEVPGLAVTSMTLDVLLDYDADRIEGSARLTVLNVGRRNEGRIPLQLGRLMTASSIRRIEAGGDIDLRFSEDVVTFHDFERYQVNQVYIELTEPLPPGAQVTVDVAYSGVLVPYTETGMLYVRDHLDSAFTVLRSEARAFPVLAIPSVAGSRSMPTLDFHVEARVTVPDSLGLTVATGYQPSASRSERGWTTWTFRSPEPVPFLNLTVAAYRERSGPGFRILHFPEDEAGADRVAVAVTAASELFRRLFGEGTGDRIAIMEIPEGWGSQAHAIAGIMQTADAFQGERRVSPLYHELFHLWHPRDAEQPAPRWNEGLATLMQYRAADILDDPGSLRRRMEGVLQRVARQAGDPVPLASLGRAGRTDEAYSQGALFFYLVYRAMGADAFDASLRKWMVSFRHAGSTTPDLMSLLEADGGRAVQRLVSDWMYGTAWHAQVVGADSIADLERRGRAFGAATLRAFPGVSRRFNDAAETFHETPPGLEKALGGSP